MGLRGKRKEIKRYEFGGKKQSQDVRYSIGNIVNNIVVTMDVPGVRRIIV